MFASCRIPPLQQDISKNKVPLIRKDAINLYTKITCPLKSVAYNHLREFVSLYNASHDVPIYSPMLLDGEPVINDSELMKAQSEDDLPDVIVASDLYKLLSGKFREKFIDTGIYTGITSETGLKKMPEKHRKIITQRNIGIFAAGYWNVVCDLSISLFVPYPTRWTDLIDPLYKDLITTHGCMSKTSITAVLMLLREQFGSTAVLEFAHNIRNVRPFSEIIKRIDSPERHRTPFNILPNAPTVKMLSSKRAAILDFEDGPVLEPMFMFVKTSRIQECKSLVSFFHSNIMQEALKCGGLHLVHEIDWQEPFSFPSWQYLLNSDNEESIALLENELKKGFRPDVFL
ncbi:ABC transporter substrate-binding protein [Candidatus Roizmanbacteria bacterium]|nr:ABC transporter substrate-binding protein [Candidatus Roizmanbacteria bacterium]